VDAVAPDRPGGKSRFVAGLLSLIMFGGGHVYIGRARRGVTLVAVFLAIQVVFATAAFLLPPRFLPIAVYFVAAVGCLVLGYFAIAFDAVRLARRSENPSPRWWVIVAAMAAIAAVSFGVATLATLVKPEQPWRIFSVPSSSMKPTLQPGEHFIGDMTYFRTHAPARGDVVLYRFPRDPGTIYVKRIVGLPGDRVEFREGRAFVNGTAEAEQSIDVGNPRAPLNNTREVSVPEGYVFVAGDNRSNSTDSRISMHGPVPLANLIGRGTEVLWSDTAARRGLWLGSNARNP
jgi:signal peptidase I